MKCIFLIYNYNDDDDDDDTMSCNGFIIGVQRLNKGLKQAISA